MIDESKLNQASEKTAIFISSPREQLCLAYSTYHNENELAQRRVYYRTSRSSSVAQ
jgi:hypothetical protein